MRLKAIESMESDILTAKDIAPILECDPHYIRVQAQQDPTKLGFPVIVYGSRVIIPKEGFIHFMRYGNAPLIKSAD